MVALALLLSLIGAPATAEEAGFTPDNLGEGIYLMRAAEERGDLVNSLVVERGDGLLIVDAQPTPEAAQELLAAIGSMSSEPIRYLVYSSPLMEAIGGASAFPESVLVIASENCAGLLEDPEYDFSSRARLQAGHPEDWTPPAIRTPALTLTAKADLADSVNTVQLLPIGHAQTGGDMIVVLPGEKIIYAGSLLPADRNPFAMYAHVGGWLNALNKIAKAAPNLVLPSRGSAVDARIVRQRAEGLAWLRGQVEEAFVQQINTARMPEKILALPDTSKYFDLDAEPSYLQGLVERVVEEAVEHRRKRGLWNE
jgi:cyclase